MRIWGIGLDAFCVAQAWHRIASTALARERLDPLAPPPSDVDDPCGTGALVYEAGLHGGYSPTSAGVDGVARADDVRFTRAPRMRD